MQLTKNFSLHELERSPTARRKGIDNRAPADAVRNLRLLCDRVLQPARNVFGTITVNSGYRSPALNRAIGGARRSDHLTGCAADIEIAQDRMHELGAWLQANTPYHQLIWEHGGQWIHVSHRPDANELEVLEAFAVRDWAGRSRTRYRSFDFMA